MWLAIGWKIWLTDRVVLRRRKSLRLDQSMHGILMAGEGSIDPSQQPAG